VTEPDDEDRFDVEYPSTIAGDIVDGIVNLISLGLAEPQVECIMTDRETGETHTGYGVDRYSARESARSGFID